MMNARPTIVVSTLLLVPVVGATAGEREQCSYGADLNLDGRIDFQDLVELLFHWGNCHVWNAETSEWENCPTQEDCDCAGDLDADDVVGFRDQLLLMTKWGPVANCPECDDAIDNDGDGLRDALDPGCWNAQGVYDPEIDDEALATTRCQDGIDNDGDGLIDFPDDPGCGNRFVNTEVEQVDPLGRPACRDGLDNDNDGTIDWGQGGSNDCFCSSPFDDSEQDVLLTEISWNEFPDFQLNDNLTVVYGGLALYPSQYYPDREDYGLVPLSRGFSHIVGDLVSPDHRDELPVERRAGLWHPPNTWRELPINDENWDVIRSPWGNDMEVVVSHWRDEMAELADLFADSRETGVPQVEYLVADVERRWINDGQMIDSQSDDRVPPTYRLLPPDVYMQIYKRDMTSLYDAGVGFPRTVYGTQSKISSYSEAPISNAAIGAVGVRHYTWEEWTTDPAVTDYIMHDYTDDEGFGEFFDSTLDFLAPSGYYFYDYPRTYEGHESEWRNVGQYLSTNLFKVDANRVWAPDREIILFQAMRMHGAGNCPNCGIPRAMAHVAAIFPFFSEGVGTWVWDADAYHNSNPNYPDITDEQQSQNRHAYNNFIYGLYRLSRYNEFFDEGYRVYHPMNARDLNAEKQPIWRGIYSADGRRMLIAATNPYAAPGEVTEYVIEVDGEVKGTVHTTGFNTFLGVCDLVNGGIVGDEGLNVE